MARRRSTSSIAPIVDRLVEQRYGAAIDAVAALQARHPSADSTTIADLLIRRATRELATVAAISGGAAAVPEVGTTAAVVSGGVDVAWTLSRLGELIMAIGTAHGHDAASFEERKAWVLSVLTMADGAATGVEGLAARLGRRGGIAVLQRLSGTELTTVNAGLGSKLATRLASAQGAARLGRFVPFGIGAGVGAAGNVLITRSVGRAAKEFFGASRDPAASARAPGRTSDGAIDVTSTERPSGPPDLSDPSHPSRAATRPPPTAPA